MPINGLMADAQQALLAQMPRHLLRAPLHADQSVDLMQIVEGEALVASRSGAPAAGTLNGFAGSIVPVPVSAIALELSRDGAAMASKLLGDLRLVQPLCSQRRETISLS
jgi:hypothetical protein